MSHRYFVETPIAGPTAVLAGPEAHHLIHVMRLRPGAEVTLFDGSGGEFAARVERLQRREVELAILSRREADRELPWPLVLGVALPKGERQRWLVEKAVELGVTRLVPLETARGVAQPTAEAIARLRRAVIEASKQCGRNRLLEIAPPQPWTRFVAAPPETARRLLAHPALPGTGSFFSPPRAEKCACPLPPAPATSSAKSQGSPDSFAIRAAKPQEEAKEEPQFLGRLAIPRAASCAFGTPIAELSVPPKGLCSSPPPGATLAIGPEGGLTDEEVAQAVAAGWQLVNLGPRILRVETAALALATLATAGLLHTSRQHGLVP